MPMSDGGFLVSGSPPENVGGGSYGYWKSHCVQKPESRKEALLYPVGNTRLDGVDNNFKVIKRKAHGLRDLRYTMVKFGQAYKRKLATKTG